MVGVCTHLPREREEKIRNERWWITLRGLKILLNVMSHFLLDYVYSDSEVKRNAITQKITCWIIELSLLYK